MCVYTFAYSCMGIVQSIKVATKGFLYGLRSASYLMGFLVCMQRRSIILRHFPEWTTGSQFEGLLENLGESPNIAFRKQEATFTANTKGRWAIIVFTLEVQATTCSCWRCVRKTLQVNPGIHPKPVLKISGGT